MQIGMIQDRILPYEQIDPVYMDRGLYFGDGVYEVLRSYNGRIFAFEEHMERFGRSLAAVAIEGVELADVRAHVLEAFRTAAIANAKIYFHVTRGSGPRDLVPVHPKPHFFLTVNELADSRADKDKGIAVSTHPDWRWKRCDIKSLNLLANVLARQDAVKKGSAEAILVNDAGLITEGAASSFFGVFRQEARGGQGLSDYVLRTAPLTANILPSVTRMFLVRAAQDIGLPVKEEAFTPHQAEVAAELIMAVTTKDVVPIVRFDGRPIGEGRPGPVALALVEAFKRYTMDPSAHKRCT